MHVQKNKSKCATVPATVMVVVSELQADFKEKVEAVCVASIAGMGGRSIVDSDGMAPRVYDLFIIHP